MAGGVGEAPQDLVERLAVVANRLRREGLAASGASARRGQAGRARSEGGRIGWERERRNGSGVAEAAAKRESGREVEGSGFEGDSVVRARLDGRLVVQCERKSVGFISGCADLVHGACSTPVANAFEIENESTITWILFVIYYLTPRTWHLSAAIQYQLADLKLRRDQT